MDDTNLRQPACHMVRTNTPELLPGMWGAVARAALAADAHSPKAWGQYSLVSRAWRDGLRDVLTLLDRLCHPSCGLLP